MALAVLLGQLDGFTQLVALQALRRQRQEVDRLLARGAVEQDAIERDLDGPDGHEGEDERHPLRLPSHVVPDFYESKFHVGLPPRSATDVSTGSDRSPR
jgi:hypothetical protein